mgnify:FL=1
MRVIREEVFCERCQKTGEVVLFRTILCRECAQKYLDKPKEEVR